MPSDYPFVICWPLYRLSNFDLCLLITPLVTFDHCIVCPTLIYAFWLPLCYMLAIASSVLLRFMPSDYLFGIFWPLYSLSYFDLCLLITPLVSFGHCIVCPTSINAFWLPLCYMLAIVSSVQLRFMPSDYPFGNFWPLYRLSYFDLCLLITTLLYVGHCIVCPTSIYAFWLPLWYLLAIVSSVLLRFMPFDYPFGIFWPLYSLSYFDLCLLITTLVSFGHCIVCPTSMYVFWLPIWYMLAIVSSVLLQCMSSDYPFVICWPLYRLSYFDLCLLITPLVYVGHCIVFPTSIYAFWLPLWYMLAIVSFFLLRFMPSDYHFGICWPLYRLSYFNVCLPITPLLYVGHCIVCPTSIYAFWLPLWYLLALSFASSVLLWFMPSDYPFGIFDHCIVCPTLICAFWLPLWYHLAIVSSVLLWFVPSDYPFDIFWPLYRLSFFDLCLLITTLVSFGHCIVCPTSINAFWLPLCYMLAIVSSALLRLMPFDYPFVICWPLYRLSYFDKCLLITTLVSFGHCIFCPTSINAFWLPFSYMLAIISSVLLRFMPSDYHIGIFWPLYRLSYFDLCLLVTILISFGHCIVCPTLIYAFWLPLWYLLAIVSSVLLRFVPSDYPFVICWPLYRLSYFHLCLLITPLVSFGHCIVCPTLIYAFWLSLRYLLAIASSVLLWFMPSDYPFGIFWPLYRLSYFDLCLLITPLVSFGHCIVCPTLICAFRLPLWYLLAIVSSVLLWFMPSDYPFGILWPLYCLSYFDLCLLITPLVSFGHCIVCPTLIYAFWLPLWYLLAIVSSVLLRFVPSDYPFGICWPLYRLSYFELRLLITHLVSFGHCIVFLTSIDGFWLTLSYLQTFLSMWSVQGTTKVSEFDSRSCKVY